eukprot:3939399-Rhodomonas_salina.1
MSQRHRSCTQEIPPPNRCQLGNCRWLPRRSCQCCPARSNPSQRGTQSSHPGLPPNTVPPGIGPGPQSQQIPIAGGAFRAAGEPQPRIESSIALDQGIGGSRKAAIEPRGALLAAWLAQPRVGPRVAVAVRALDLSLCGSRLRAVLSGWACHAGRGCRAGIRTRNAQRRGAPSLWQAAVAARRARRACPTRRREECCTALRTGASTRGRRGARSTVFAPVGHVLCRDARAAAGPASVARGAGFCSIPRVRAGGASGERRLRPRGAIAVADRAFRTVLAALITLIRVSARKTVCQRLVSGCFVRRSRAEAGLASGAIFAPRPTLARVRASGAGLRAEDSAGVHLVWNTTTVLASGAIGTA